MWMCADHTLQPALTDLSICKICWGCIEESTTEIYTLSYRDSINITASPTKNSVPVIPDSTNKLYSKWKNKLNYLLICKV